MLAHGVLDWLLSKSADPTGSLLPTANWCPGRGRELSDQRASRVQTGEHHRTYSPQECSKVQVAITTRHGTLSPSAQAHMTEKAEKLLTIFSRITAIQVTVNFEHAESVVEILVDAEHKHNFVASESNSDATVAFDTALHKMEQQIRKYKEKIQDHH
jgi:putative sigma-54 modulation protein